LRGRVPRHEHPRLHARHPDQPHRAGGSMSITRVTQTMLSQRSLEGMQLSLGRLARTQEQLSTGRVLNRPSDSPTDTTAAMRLRSSLADAKQYARNAQDGQGWLGQIDSALQSMVNETRRA